MTTEYYKTCILPFVNKYADAINANDFDSVFNHATGIDSPNTSQLFHFLYQDVGINPLPCMKNLYSKIFDDEDLYRIDSAITIPSNIVNIHFNSLQYCSYSQLIIQSTALDGFVVNMFKHACTESVIFDTAELDNFAFGYECFRNAEYLREIQLPTHKLSIFKNTGVGATCLENIQICSDAEVIYDKQINQADKITYEEVISYKL